MHAACSLGQSHCPWLVLLFSFNEYHTSLTHDDMYCQRNAFNVTGTAESYFIILVTVAATVYQQIPAAAAP